MIGYYIAIMMGFIAGYFVACLMMMAKGNDRPTSKEWVRLRDKEK